MCDTNPGDSKEHNNNSGQNNHQDRTRSSHHTRCDHTSSNSSTALDLRIQILQLHTVPEVQWRALTKTEKAKRVLWRYISCPIFLIACFYFFICSLYLLSSAFKLVAVKKAVVFLTGAVDEKVQLLLNDKVAGVMIGVVITAVIQSSSLVTSILVSMVAAEFISLKAAIPIVVGANFGTAITSTIVSLGQCSDKEQYRRAFSAAVVHDTFNWLTVCVVLPLEYVTELLTPSKQGFLEYLSAQSVLMFKLEGLDGGGPKLHTLTEPFTDFIIQINDARLLAQSQHNGTQANFTSIIRDDSGSWFLLRYLADTDAQRDLIVGLVLLFLSLTMLFLTLTLIIKLLQSLLRTSMFKFLHKFANANIPGKCGKISTGYLAILVGTGLTIIVQSSSTFISAILIPFAGLDVIALDRIYTLTLGANLGTVCTAILGALSVNQNASRTLQLALCHLYFNLVGILIWYPAPVLRKVPILLATKLGSITGKHRWFSVLYLVVFFFALPILVVALIYGGGTALFLGIFVPVLCLCLTILGVNHMQKTNPMWLPKRLRTWKFILSPGNHPRNQCANCNIGDCEPLDPYAEITSNV